MNFPEKGTRIFQSLDCLLRADWATFAKRTLRKKRRINGTINRVMFIGSTVGVMTAAKIVQMTIA